jgi:hypothetical protein
MRHKRTPWIHRLLRSIRVGIATVGTQRSPPSVPD